MIIKKNAEKDVKNITLKNSFSSRKRIKNRGTKNRSKINQVFEKYKDKNEIIIKQINNNR